MKKYLVISIIVILAGLVMWFLIQNRGLFSAELSEVGNDLISPTPQVPDDKNSPNESINSLDNKEVTKTMTNATINTNMGSIEIELFEEQAPKTVANFIELAKDGFYNGVKFHRVIKGFMIQGGDPLTKDDSQMSLWGTGGPGYSFADEIGANNKNDIGTIAMANAGPNTNGSQFFINVAANNFLDTKHTVFGKVVSGMDVVIKIENTGTSAGDRPIKSVIINGIVLK